MLSQFLTFLRFHRHIYLHLYLLHETEPYFCPPKSGALVPKGMIAMRALSRLSRRIEQNPLRVKYLRPSLLDKGIP